MTHREHHPEPVADCFGCKVLGIGYDGKHVTRRTVVQNEHNGGVAGHHVEHRDGRQDAYARAMTVHATVSRKDGPRGPGSTAGPTQ